MPRESDRGVEIVNDAKITADELERRARGHTGLTDFGDPSGLLRPTPVTDHSSGRSRLGDGEWGLAFTVEGQAADCWCQEGATVTTQEMIERLHDFEDVLRFEPASRWMPLK